MNLDSNVKPQEDIFNVPNKISAARLVLSFVFFALVPFQLYWAAFIVFVIAAGTDWVDGWYARKYNMVTKLGRVLDPFCDKILICGAYILLAVEMDGLFPWYGCVAGWMAVVVVGRELMVTVLRSMIEGAGGDFSAKLAGKLKMGFQCIAVGACLVGLAMKLGSPTGLTAASAIPEWLHWTIVVSVWLSVLSTVHSGWLYIIGAANFIKQ
ncbi:MAG: CDP-diacylglycerol--glycerol-3-phosphate 3-phosphatidyltransferase [Mariniblastus sp.]|jgi:CDP-diacylglycerol--glycerol-3-phosphate 3-phosphatidyltransferase